MSQGVFMAFVNEKISEEDKKRYGMDVFDKKPGYGQVRAENWTVDRERNMYFRVISRGREEFMSESTWHFYWGSQLFEVDLDRIEGPSGGHRSGYYKLTRLRKDGVDVSPTEQLLTDLKEAMCQYADGGIYRKAKTFDVILSVA